MTGKKISTLFSFSGRKQFNGIGYTQSFNTFMDKLCKKDTKYFEYDFSAYQI